jgi:CTP synthase
MARFIFITGGVVSSLGKGLTSAALGALLQARGFKVRLRKLDPYLNVDPGTMSPYQHGEVYVTDDGAETDLDLGHYERYTGVASRKSDNVTTGQIYSEVIARERRGDYLGATVQVIPHVTDAIKAFIRADVTDEDFVVCEIGGTVGDIEGLPFLEAIRQLGNELGRAGSMFIHLTLLPFIASAGELKTKPTQHSVKELQSLGIQPDVLVCRSEHEIPRDARRKIALFCNLREEAVIQALDVDTIYAVPRAYHEEGLDGEACRHFGLENRTPDLSVWDRVTDAIRQPDGEVTIGVVGKYTTLLDAYKSLAEALTHGGIANNLGQLARFGDFRDRRRGAGARGGPRHLGARRLRRARRRGQDRGGPLRPRAQSALFRHLLRHADGGYRGGAQPGRHQRGRLERVRALRRTGGWPADRVDPRQRRRAAQHRRRPGRHHAARRLSLRRRAG